MCPKNFLTGPSPVFSVLPQKVDETAPGRNCDVVTPLNPCNDVARRPWDDDAPSTDGRPLKERTGKRLNRALRVAIRREWTIVHRRQHRGKVYRRCRCADDSPSDAFRPLNEPCLSFSSEVAVSPRRKWNRAEVGVVSCWPRNYGRPIEQAIIFCRCGFLFICLLRRLPFFSSPILSGLRLNV